MVQSLGIGQYYNRLWLDVDHHSVELAPSGPGVRCASLAARCEEERSRLIPILGHGP